MPKVKTYKIGLVDADLLCNGTRHPNLALLKIAGYFHDNGFYRVQSGVEIINGSTYELITNDCNFEELHSYDHIYVSCVFSFTLDTPPDVLKYLMTNKDIKKKVHIGGTGSYANLPVDGGFQEAREEDMHRLEKDKFLLKFKDKKTQENGINMQTQMPDYHLYDEFIGVMETVKKSPKYYKDYKEYSIGFLTRGCFRRCPFCVNKLERKSMPYSNLNDFLDQERDEKGKLVRPYIYLWDDNFLASPYWERLLDELIATGRPFQFRQGLDERLLAQNKRGEDMARKLANANYHGDFIFAFDNWFDRKLIVKALKIWKYHCPKKETKFYLFCGFQQTPTDDKKFQLDIAEIFMRICVLMRYGCLGYIMRHEDYKKAPLSNIYVQIARWCNQPGFYRNLSFWEYCYKNQTYWEEHTLGIKHERLKSYEEFLEDLRNGYYDDKKICLTLKTCHEFLESHKPHKKLFLSFFDMSFKKMTNPALWARE